MHRIWAVALNTYKETVRDRILLIIVLFGVMILLSTRILTPLALGQQSKLVRDIGLAGISLWGLAICIIVGTNLVYKEVSLRTLYTLLSKPIRRTEFLLGKYLGLIMLLLTVFSLMTLVLYGAIWWVDRRPELELLLAIGMSFLELALVTNFALLFSSFTAPGLGAFFTAAVFAIGHMSGDLLRLSEQVPNTLVKIIANGLYYLIPNLEIFNIRAEIIYKQPVTPARFSFAIIYCLLWSLLLLIITAAIFREREIK